VISEDVFSCDRKLRYYFVIQSSSVLLCYSNNPKEVKEHPAFPYQKEFGAGTGSKQAIL